MSPNQKILGAGKKNALTFLTWFLTFFFPNFFQVVMSHLKMYKTHWLKKSGIFHYPPLLVILVVMQLPPQGCDIFGTTTVTCRFERGGK